MYRPERKWTVFVVAGTVTVMVFGLIARLATMRSPSQAADDSLVVVFERLEADGEGVDIVSSSLRFSTVSKGFSADDAVDVTEPIIDSEYMEAMPRLSPTGDRVAYMGTTLDANNVDIYVVGTDGRDLMRVTSDTQPDSVPAWSPDGTMVAFSRSNESGEWHVWIANVDPNVGSFRERQITFGPMDGQPTWSPDGQAVAFTRNAAGNADIFEVNVATGKEARLTSNVSGDGDPAFLPDGSLLFTRTLDDGDPVELVRLSANVGEESVVSRDLGTNVSSLAVSNDGTAVAYVGAGADGEMHAHYADLGTGLVNTLPVPAAGAGIDW